jgi:hypothetical protein
MEVLIIGIVTAINLIVIKMKFEQKRWEEASLDLGLLIVVALVFGGSYAGLVVGTIASMIISVYLYASPPTFTKDIVLAIKEIDKEVSKTEITVKSSAQLKKELSKL